MSPQARMVFFYASGSLMVTLAFFAGRASVSETERERQCLDLVDEMVVFTHALEVRLNTISSVPCDCPGPEACDIEATCNRDAMWCCLELTRQVPVRREEAP